MTNDPTIRPRWNEFDQWARLAAQRLRRTGVAQSFVGWALRNEFQWGGPNGWTARQLRRVVYYGMVPRPVRDRSVGALVELFFGLIDDLDVTRFVEAGAKEATASQRAISMRTRPDVVAFEANPHTYKRFAASVKESGVDYEHLALSDTPGQLTFHVRRGVDGAPLADGQSSMLVRPNHDPGYIPVEVAAVTLDGFFADRDGGAIGTARAAWWVDVEGAVAPVMRGGRALLDRTDVLLIEVEEQPCWSGQEWIVGDVVTFLAGAGFRPVARDAQSRVQYNLVFVRETDAERPAVAQRLASWRSSSSATA